MTHRARLTKRTLSPSLTLRPSFPFYPRSTLEASIVFHIDPRFLGGVREVAGAMLDAVRVMANGAAVRETPFPKKRALRLIQDIAYWELESRSWLGRWLDWKRRRDGSLRVGVRPRSPVSVEDPQSTPVRLTVSMPRRPPVDLMMTVAELGMVHRLLVALREEPSAAREHLTSPVAGQLLDAITTVGGWIDRAEPPPVFLMPLAERSAFTVTHMGHASLVVDGGGRRILFDPWLFSPDEELERQPLTPAELGKIDAIFFTHHHEDHLQFASLLGLPCDTPVYLPREEELPLGPRVAELLGHLGYTDVRTLDHHQIARVGDFEVRALPFHGESRDLMGFGGNTYLVSRKDKHVLLHADAAPDLRGRSLLTDGTVDALREELGPLDAIYGTWWQQREFALALSPLAFLSPYLPPERWLDNVELCDCPPEFVATLARRSGAKLCVFYAEGGPALFEAESSRPRFTEPIAFFWKDVAVYRKRLEQAGVRLFEAHPYQTVRLPLAAAAAPSVRDSRA